MKKLPIKRIALGVFTFFVLVSISLNIYVVDEGERALVIRLGTFDRIQSQGLHFKTPFIEDKYIMSIRVKGAEFTNLQAYTTDNQIVTGSLLVPYRLDPGRLKALYIEYGAGFEDNLLRHLIEGSFREGLGKTQAMTLAQQRDKVGNTIGATLTELLEPYGVIVLESNVKLSSMDFSKQFDERIAAALNEKAAVEESRQKAIKAEQDAIAAKNKAKGIADAVREAADGEAYALEQVSTQQAAAKERIGAAEAKALAARGKAIADNPALISLLRAEAALKWTGVLPTTFIPGSALPFLDIAKMSGK